jgi:hemerythrin
MKNIDVYANDIAQSAARMVGLTESHWRILSHHRLTTMSWAEPVANSFTQWLFREPTTSMYLANYQQNERNNSLTLWFERLLSGNPGPGFWSDCAFAGMLHASAGIDGGLIVVGAERVFEVVQSACLNDLSPSDAVEVLAAFRKVFSTAVSVMISAGDRSVRELATSLAFDAQRLQQKLLIATSTQMHEVQGNVQPMLWNNSLSVGIDSLDQQHRLLFDLLGEFRQAALDAHDIKVTNNVLSELIEYTKIHFGYEETILQQYGYPGLDPHRSAHRILAKQVEQFVDATKQGSTPLGAELYLFLRTWLNTHIRGTDRRYSSYLKERGANLFSHVTLWLIFFSALGMYNPPL